MPLNQTIKLSCGPESWEKLFFCKTESILVTLNLEGECNTHDTPAEYGPLGKYPIENPYREAFRYASVVG